MRADGTKLCTRVPAQRRRGPHAATAAREIGWRSPKTGRSRAEPGGRGGQCRCRTGRQCCHV